jgi:D-amino peptidase
MKVYISADIEGVTGVVHWNETEKNLPDFNDFAVQMTKEVAAACQGASAAGAEDILVKDAHDSPSTGRCRFHGNTCGPTRYNHHR